MIVSVPAPMRKGTCETVSLCKSLRLWVKASVKALCAQEKGKEDAHPLRQTSFRTIVDQELRSCVMMPLRKTIAACLLKLKSRKTTASWRKRQNISEL